MATPTVHPFSQAVVTAMRKLYPEKLADISFDNTGLLLEAPYRPGRLKNSALLTIDLTKAVADEAIANRNSIIVTYHPIIFRPLKSITQSNSQQNTLLRLAQEGISVYSPHTAVDAAPEGLNDFLADAVLDPSMAASEKATSHERSVIIPVKNPPEGFETAGYGRIVKLSSPQKLGVIVSRILDRLQLSDVSVAVPQSHQGKKSEIEISSIGICAGSGGSMLNGLDVDLLFTGELSHHEALAAIEQGKCVITTFHSNSERAFIHKVLPDQLSSAIHGQNRGQNEKQFCAGQLDDQVSFDIEVSKMDRDPFASIKAKNDHW